MAHAITINSRGRPSSTMVRKAENDVTQITIDYSLFFGDDTASTIAVSADSGLTVDSSSVTANIASIVVSGGAERTLYDLTVKLTGTTETKESVIQVLVDDYDNPQTTDYQG